MCEGGPTGGQRVEVTLPTTQGAQGVSPARGRDPREPGDGGEGEVEVKVQTGAEAGGGGGGMAEYAPDGTRMVFLFFCLAELGGRRSGSPSMTRSGLGQDLVM